MRRVHLYVSGRVQGVCFRAETMDCARRMGITGWVRNLRDQRVEIIAQGTPERVSEFIAWCRRGPRLARVDHMEIIEETPVADVASFAIRY